MSRLFGGGRAESSRHDDAASQHAVLIHLDGTSLRDDVYATCDISSLEDQLVEAIDAAAAGELDGNEVGPTETVVYLYGPDGERLYSAIETVLRNYPLCQNARVVIRSGGPGAPERTLRLPQE